MEPKPLCADCGLKPACIYSRSHPILCFRCGCNPRNVAKERVSKRKKIVSRVIGQSREKPTTTDDL